MAESGPAVTVFVTADLGDNDTDLPSFLRGVVS